jgi:hypothetical protein
MSHVLPSISMDYLNAPRRPCDHHPHRRADQVFRERIRFCEGVTEDHQGWPSPRYVQNLFAMILACSKLLTTDMKRTSRFPPNIRNITNPNEISLGKGRTKNSTVRPGRQVQRCPQACVQTTKTSTRDDNCNNDAKSTDAADDSNTGPLTHDRSLDLLFNTPRWRQSGSRLWRKL